MNFTVWQPFFCPADYYVWLVTVSTMVLKNLCSNFHGRHATFISYCAWLNTVLTNHWFWELSLFTRQLGLDVAWFDFFFICFKIVIILKVHMKIFQEPFLGMKIDLAFLSRKSLFWETHRSVLVESWWLLKSTNAHPRDTGSLVPFLEDFTTLLKPSDTTTKQEREFKPT